jgi:hypothetical protein
MRYELTDDDRHQTVAAEFSIFAAAGRCCLEPA